LATPPDGTKLSLGKLGRATAVDNDDYTSKTSLNDAARDSGTDKTTLSSFYVESVDNSIDGYAYVDEQTNETYTMGFTNSNTLFDSRVKTRHQNFTWTTSNSSLFELQSNQDFSAQYNAQTIAEVANTGFISKSFEANIVTGGHDFGAWDNTNNLTHWTESGGSVIQLLDVSSYGSFTKAPSGSNPYMVKFISQGGSISQTMTVKGNSVYEIVSHASSSAANDANLELEVSGAYTQETHKSIIGTDGNWGKFRDDFYTSGSSNVDQNLKLTFTAVSCSNTSVGPLLDSVFVRRWEGANFSDQEVTISGKFHEDGQSDGFNDHATRYNTAVEKTVEIQDTYGGLSIACFLPGTLIHMADGTTKLIENLNVGEEVLSIDLPNLPDEDLGREVWTQFTMRAMDATELETLMSTNSSTATVESLFYDFMPGYMSINDDEIKVTIDHEFWVFQGGLWRWKRSEEIEVGSLLYTQLGGTKRVDSIEFISGDVEVIQFDVEPLDVYFAGGVLVHNKGTDSDPA